MWAVRCTHEAELYDDNCFLTLTYSEENIPPLGSLRKEHFIKFMKRFRDRIGYGRIRFFACGEYGDETNRPHYHALIFNYDFPDKEFYKFTPSGDKLFVSPLLEDIWGLGQCQIGSVNFQSAGYVARYSLKKITGDVDIVAAHYGGREFEFLDMSRQPGIGAPWLKKYAKDVFPADSIVVNGVRVPVPRFYDVKYEIVDASRFKRIKRKRKVNGRLAAKLVDNSPSRLRARAEVVSRRLDIHKRGSL